MPKFEQRLALFPLQATPGRLAEHIKQSTGFAHHHLSTIKHLVLDEADRMLTLEFADDLDLLLNLFLRPNVSTKSKTTFLDNRAKEVSEKNKVKEKGQFWSTRSILTSIVLISKVL